MAASPQAAPSTAPITVIALAHLKPGSEAAFEAASNRILKPSRAEAGNLKFTYHRSLEQPGQYGFVELWRTEDALEAHLKSPHMQAFFNEVGALFEPGYPQIMKFREVL
jgi:quinol monooxygenase YgiN